MWLDNNYFNCFLDCFDRYPVSVYAILNHFGSQVCLIIVLVIIMVSGIYGLGLSGQLSFIHTCLYFSHSRSHMVIWHSRFGIVN